MRKSGHLLLRVRCRERVHDEAGVVDQDAVALLGERPVEDRFKLGEQGVRLVCP
jgi:hypothetical protein